MSDLQYRRIYEVTIATPSDQKESSEQGARDTAAPIPRMLMLLTRTRSARLSSSSRQPDRSLAYRAPDYPPPALSFRFLCIFHRSCFSSLPTGFLGPQRV